VIIEKTYLCPIIGSGTREDPRRPSLADVPIDKAWFMIELGKVEGNDFCLISIVADEMDHQKIALGKDDVHFATRTLLRVDSSTLDVLKNKFPKLLEKLENVKSCWVTLQQQTGKEE